MVKLRREYHRSLCRSLLGRREGGALSCADTDNDLSRRLSEQVAESIGFPLCPTVPKGQTLGTCFTEITLEFLKRSFALLEHIRPGDWGFRAEAAITQFDQYEHLALLDDLLSEHSEARAALGRDYLITPDIVIFRQPLDDAQINATRVLVLGDRVATRTPLRAANSDRPCPILHATASCKWTIRSDRAQNTRTEALNLIR